MRVIVDADYLVYSTGFAVEKTRYDITSEWPDGTVHTVVVDTKDEAVAWLISEPSGSKTQIDKLVEAEPVSHALFLVDRVLQTVDTNLSQAGIEFNRMELFLTGRGNFRDELATIREYKGNRDPDAKPYHYKSIRRYLVNKWGATVVDGIEADDKVAEIMSGSKDVILVGIDKDLLTIPGRHYHFKTKTFRDVSEQEALVNFYRQCVTGDVVDNIGGAYKAGPAKAAGLNDAMSESEMYQYVLGLYARGREMKGCPYAHLSAEDALIENARLLHLRRHDGDLWYPPAERSPAALGSSGA